MIPITVLSSHYVAHFRALEVLYYMVLGFTKKLINLVCQRTMLPPADLADGKDANQLVTSKAT